MLKLLGKFSLLLSLLLLLSACSPKHNGQYTATYSYHPYKTLYPNTIKTSHKEESFQAQKLKVKLNKGENPFKLLEQKQVPKRVSFNESDFYPSNVPAKR